MTKFTDKDLVDNTECDLLFRCLYLEAKEQKINRLVKFSNEDWQNISLKAKRYGLMPLLYKRLRGLSPNIDIPKGTWKELREAYLCSTGRNLCLYNELSKILEAFREHELPVIPLKGAYLSEVIYQDIATRSMGDIDLLIKTDHLEKACQILRSRGYSSISFEIAKEIKRNQHLPHFHKPNFVNIELHWTIVPPNSSYKADVDGLWRRAQAATIAKTEVLALSPEDMLVHLCLHYCRHKFYNGLTPLLDITELLQFFRDRIDWKQVLELSQTQQACRCVYLVLQLASEWFNAPVPPDWLAGLKPPDFSSQVLSLAKKRTLGFSQPPLLHPNLVDLWSKQPWRVKLGTLIKICLPKPEILAQKYSLQPGSFEVYLYYPVRWKDLLIKSGNQALRAMRGDRNPINFIDQENWFNDRWLGS